MFLLAMGRSGHRKGRPAKKLSSAALKTILSDRARIEFDFAQGIEHVPGLQSQVEKLLAEQQVIRGQKPRTKGEELRLWRHDERQNMRKLGKARIRYLTELVEFARKRKESPENQNFFLRALKRAQEQQKKFQ